MDQDPSILQRTILELASEKATEDLLTTTETAFNPERINFLLGNFVVIQSFLSAETQQPVATAMIESLVAKHAAPEIIQSITGLINNRRFNRYVFSLTYFNNAASDYEREDYGLEVTYRRLPRTDEVRKSTTLNTERFLLRHLMDQ